MGLDREAAKEALAAFLWGRTLQANQLQFVNLIVDDLTRSGLMPVERLYELPFTDIDLEGVGGFFPRDDADALVRVLENVRQRAVA